MPGKLIVIDGADGSGKATQSGLLYERLKREGKDVETMDFPRYADNFFGKLIRECLDGKCGDFMSVHPKIVSALYAADRYESSARINEWLARGAAVILDRYVSANMVHQGAKISDETELASFLEWLDQMEHGIFNIPRPDTIFFLDVPQSIRKELVSNDVSRGAADLAERDDAHQRASERSAKKVAELSKNWHIVSCVEGNMLRTKEAIHDDIYTMVCTLL